MNWTWALNELSRRNKVRRHRWVDDNFKAWLEVGGSGDTVVWGGFLKDQSVARYADLIAFAVAQDWELYDPKTVTVPISVNVNITKDAFTPDQVNEIVKLIEDKLKRVKLA